MIALAILAAAQAGGWQADPVVTERLGPGPHTLVIADGNAMREMAYRTGAACLHARDAVRRQVASPPPSRGYIPGPPRVKAFCVPR